jgi:ABC-type nitrate/sulfonate/bicarbonate transport system substrate-binding protein
MDKIHFPYRADSHLRLLHVVQESGAWEKHGLDVNYDYCIDAEEAHKAIADGTIEFVSGTHVSPYSERPKGDRWIYLGQTVRHINFDLILKPDSEVSGVADLKGRVVAHRGGGHPSLNVWLYFKQRGLDVDAGGVTFEVIKQEDKLWEAVRQGAVAAAVVVPPANLRARRAGLKALRIDPLPMIEFTTFSSGLPFVEKHPEIVERFLKAMVEGIAFFKTRRKETTDIIKRRYKADGDLDDETAAYLYDELNDRLFRKPYPTMEAVHNAYQLALRQDNTAEKTNPMELWDLFHLRKIDDSGFIDRLYA